MRSNRQVEVLELFSLVTNCSSVISRKKTDAYSCVEVVVSAYESPPLFAFLSETRNRLIY